MSDQTEHEDTCRPIEVDGETVLIRGAGEFTEQEQQFATEIVRAAKRKFESDHAQSTPSPARDQTAPDTEPTDLRMALIELRHLRAEVARLRPFVAVADGASRAAEHWEGETKRWLAFIERGMETHMRFGVIREDGTREELPCADWCYACRLDRAEQIAKALHIHLHALRARPGREITTDFVRAVLGRLIKHPEEVCDLDKNEATIARVIDLYERWVKAGPPPLGTPMARWWDKRLVELHDAILPPANQTKEQ